MIRVISEVNVYMVDGKDPDEDASLATDEQGRAVIEVLSHWNRPELVVLEVAGRRYTLSARELEIAIANATNTGRL